MRTELYCRLTVAGAGAGGIKWLRTGEQPRRKDRWEGLMLLLPEIRAGAPSFIARDDPDAAWMQQHEQLGNEVGPASDSGAVAAARTTLGDGR